MASTQIIVNGYSVLGDPRVNANMSGSGNIMIHGGTHVFQPDDIIVVDVIGATPEGEITSSALITKITVYDNAAAYFAGLPKYVYEASDPTDYGEIDGATDGLGDTYLTFDAGDLVSTNPSAPRLGDVLLTPGIDTSGNLKGRPITIARVKDVDYNGDALINAGTSEVGNGFFSSDNNIFAQICLARGSRIETPRGIVRIEDLATGDLVNTLDHGPQPIRWIGSRRVAGDGKHAPIRIKAGALGNTNDLVVSPNHRMLIHGARAELLFGEPQVLVAAKHLINDNTIRIHKMPTVDYFHFLFDAHEIVFAESIPTESLYPGRETLNAVSDEAREEIVELFPELRSHPCVGLLSRYELTKYEAEVFRRTA